MVLMAPIWAIPAPESGWWRLIDVMGELSDFYHRYMTGEL